MIDIVRPTDHYLLCEKNEEDASITVIENRSSVVMEDDQSSHSE